MAHYAFLDGNNIVTEVIVGKEEGGDTDFEVFYGNIRSQTCKRTSYNTRFGQHILGGTPFRKNYAGIGFTYDQSRDAFIPSKPFASWVLNETTCVYDSPVTYPTDGKNYVWDESIVNWKEE